MHTFRVTTPLGVQRIHNFLIRYAESTYILEQVDVVVVGGVDACGDPMRNVGGCVGQACVVSGRDGVAC
jgi:hypothetical protein